MGPERPLTMHRLSLGTERDAAVAETAALVRIVDQKIAVVPLHADTLADPNKLLASARSLLGSRTKDLFD